jgi:hypothetical protein
MKRILEAVLPKIAYQQIDKAFKPVANPIKRLKRGLHNIIRIKFKQAARRAQIWQDIKPSSTTFFGKRQHTFFGYYDLSPFNQNGKRLLAMQLNTSLATPDKNTVMNVGYFDIETNKPGFVVVGQTTTWCWQQGCRLQWYPSASEETIFYNTLSQNQYGAVIQEIKSGKIRHTIQHPIYDLCRNGNWGLSLNFSRLQRLRPGYGYVNLPDQSKTVYCPTNDGVWLIDIQKNKAHLLFSMSQLAKVSPHESMNGAQHYINHLSFNPSGRDFLFFHLWLDQNNRRYSRLFTADVQGNRLTLLNNIGHVSHYTWLTDERLVVTTHVSPKRNLRYVLYHHTDGFEGIIGNQHLTTDGHPNFIRSGYLMITDTYPDEFRDQKLLVFNTEKDSLKVIERFNMPSEFTGEVRCDLHPRPSQTGNLICVDNVVKGLRVMTVIDISKIQ